MSAELHEVNILKFSTLIFTVSIQKLIIDSGPSQLFYMQVKSYANLQMFFVLILKYLFTFTVTFIHVRSSCSEVFCKKGVLRNFEKFTGKQLCQSLFFNKKETLTQLLSCEFCKTSRNTFSYRTPPVTASDMHYSE